MNFSYSDFKWVIYVLETALGIGLILLSNYIWAGSAGDPVNQLSALVLLLGGLMSVLFGCMTFALRHDPDIWR